MSKKSTPEIVQIFRHKFLTKVIRLISRRRLLAFVYFHFMFVNFRKLNVHMTRTCILNISSLFIYEINIFRFLNVNIIAVNIKR